MNYCDKVRDSAAEMRCQVKLCGRRRKTHPDVSFYRFPRDPSLRARWVDFCEVADDWKITDAMRICSVRELFEI